MGFFDNLKNQMGSQFIEIIEWLDDSTDTLVYRFPVYNQEIKMGAQLTVRENQVALFVNEGEVADVFKPGRYELSTQNIPIMTTLRGWKYGFNSPFKAEVYFFNTRLFTDLKWGTANPVMMRDAEFGMIRMRAYGTYAMKIGDAKEFFKTIVGTQGLTTTEDILGQLRSTIISNFSDIVAESKIAALDLASSSRDSSSTTSRCPRKSRPRSTSGRSSACSATRCSSTRRCRPRNRSKSRPRIPAGSPARVRASVLVSQSVRRWATRSAIRTIRARRRRRLPATLPRRLRADPITPRAGRSRSTGKRTARTPMTRSRRWCSRVR
jgi:hypothetical protein